MPYRREAVTASFGGMGMTLLATGISWLQSREFDRNIGATLMPHPQMNRGLIRKTY
ncbi:MAG: hypothetical protein AAGE59_23960 [Cyanobacteria bacterium P01_F01_bin.86]